jgi:hypothetical protein
MRTTTITTCMQFACPSTTSCQHLKLQVKSETDPKLAAFDRSPYSTDELAAAWRIRKAHTRHQGHTPLTQPFSRVPSKGHDSTRCLLILKVSDKAMITNNLELFTPVLQLCFCFCTQHSTPQYRVSENHDTFQV